MWPRVEDRSIGGVLLGRVRRGDDAHVVEGAALVDQAPDLCGVRQAKDVGAVEELARVGELEVRAPAGHGLGDVRRQVMTTSIGRATVWHFDTLRVNLLTRERNRDTLHRS
jgi:hypothetical protein